MAPADSVDTYELAESNNVVVSRSAETPVWGGYEGDVIRLLIWMEKDTKKDSEKVICPFVGGSKAYKA